MIANVVSCGIYVFMHNVAFLNSLKSMESSCMWWTFKFSLLHSNISPSSIINWRTFRRWTWIWLIWKGRTQFSWQSSYWFHRVNVYSRNKGNKIGRSRQPGMQGIIANSKMQNSLNICSSPGFLSFLLLVTSFPFLTLRPPPNTHIPFYCSLRTLTTRPNHKFMMYWLPRRRQNTIHYSTLNYKQLRPRNELKFSNLWATKSNNKNDWLVGCRYR